jgi:uncharacterized protein
MDTSAPLRASSAIDVRAERVSTVIVHRVPADCEKLFMEWQHGVTRAAEAFPGYQSTDLYPPANPKQPEAVVVVHFNDGKSLQQWLDSPIRAEWTAKLPAQIAQFQMKTLSEGFGPWFAGLVADGHLPPGWKMALSVLLGLYPTVMILSLFVSPHLQGLNLAVAMLIGNVLSVCILQWLVMPVLNPVLATWMRANDARSRDRSLSGLALIVVALGAITFLFSRFTA